MSRTIASAVVITISALAFAAGCTKQSEKYCAMHPEDLENCTPGDDGGIACTSDPECASVSPATPLCDDASHTCVECTPTRDEACTVDRHVCDVTACRPCLEHAECASGVCEAGGTCAEETNVAYVSETGTGDCTRASPCGDLLEAENTAKPIIKISGVVTDDNVAVFDARSTTIYADPGARLTRSSAGNIIQLQNQGTELSIYGLYIRGSTMGMGLGSAISIPSSAGLTPPPKLLLDRVLITHIDGSAVRAADGGDVTISRSVIANNTGSQGLYLLGGSFSITNTVIAQNGNTNVGTGGAYLDPARPSRFEFNTVADNISMGGATAFRGVTCLSTVLLKNSLFAGNEINGCDAEYSLFGAGDLVVGTGTLEGLPRFVSFTTPTDVTFYRINVDSAAKDQADPAATLTMDIDGNMRPIDGRSDMGADEVAP